jgi:hypothetical protein
MSHSNWFNEMWDKAPHVSHITQRVRNGLHLIIVFEDEAGTDMSEAPSNGRGVLHCAVVDRSHRREARVTFSSNAANGGMKFTHDDSARPAEEGECTLKIYKEIELKALDLVFECSMDVEVKNPRVPQEIFETTPTVDEFRSRAKGRVKDSLAPMRNMVSISRSKLSDHASRYKERSLPPALTIGSKIPAALLPEHSVSIYTSIEGKLAGKQYELLQNALVDAFPQGLTQFVRFHLDITLDTITASDASLQDQAFKLIQHCEAHGLVPKLLAAARTANPTNGKLLALEQEINLASPNM